MGRAVGRFGIVRLIAPVRRQTASGRGVILERSNSSKIQIVVGIERRIVTRAERDGDAAEAVCRRDSVVSKPDMLILPPPGPAPLQAEVVSPFTLTHQSFRTVLEATAAWLNASRAITPETHTSQVVSRSS